MAISKHPFGRYQIIDRELSEKDWVKTKELKKIIESELSINVSERMINEDINAMRYDSLLGYFAPIEYDNTHKAYFYADKSYTIKAFGLKDSDINALMFYAKAINQYKEYDIFKNFSNAIDKVLDAVIIRKGIANNSFIRSIVQTENTPKLTGSELIPIIIQALDTNRVIEFEYQKFEDSAPSLRKLHPYLLKEDRHRWYILGQVNENTPPTKTYALDRISKIKLLDTTFKSIDFDFEKHFAFSFGITVTDDEPLEIILSFTPFQGKYLKTLKLHNSQTVLIDNEREFRISIRVKPSWELYEKLLGYGEKAIVLSPDCVIEEMKTKINLLSKKYQI